MTRNQLPLLAALLLAFSLALATASPALSAKIPYADWSSLDGSAIVEFRSGATPTDRWGVPHQYLQGYLRKPVGDGPFPAVVLLPPSFWGVLEHNVRWADRLVEWGYVALLVNTPRRFDHAGTAATDADIEDASPETAAHDAYGALDFLRRQRFVDPSRVALIGWAEGGSAILQGLQGDRAQPNVPRREFAGEALLRFRAGIAYYPVCPRGSNRGYYAPILVLIGGRNHYSVEDCVGLGGGTRVKVYPKATFLFDIGVDVPEFFPALDSVYDENAERDSIREARAFLTAAMGVDTGRAR